MKVTIKDLIGNPALINDIEYLKRLRLNSTSALILVLSKVVPYEKLPEECFIGLSLCLHTTWEVLLSYPNNNILRTAISKSPEYSYLFAVRIKGRFPEGEEAIFKHKSIRQKYEKHIKTYR